MHSNTKMIYRNTDRPVPVIYRYQQGGVKKRYTTLEFMVLNSSHKVFWRSLAEISLFWLFSQSNHLKTWLPTQPSELMPFPFAFAWHDALHAVRHSHNRRPPMSISRVGVLSNSSPMHWPGLSPRLMAIFCLGEQGFARYCTKPAKFWNYPQPSSLSM